ncbi:hypothetical protein H8959_010201 [Pygathrix nigripes]
MFASGNSAGAMFGQMETRCSPQPPRPLSTWPLLDSGSSASGQNLLGSCVPAQSQRWLPSHDPVLKAETGPGLVSFPPLFHSFRTLGIADLDGSMVTEMRMHSGCPFEDGCRDHPGTEQSGEAKKVCCGLGKRLRPGQSEGGVGGELCDAGRGRAGVAGAGGDWPPQNIPVKFLHLPVHKCLHWGNDKCCAEKLKEAVMEGTMSCPAGGTGTPPPSRGGGVEGEGSPAWAAVR